MPRKLQYLLTVRHGLRTYCPDVRSEHTAPPRTGPSAPPVPHLPSLSLLIFLCLGSAPERLHIGGDSPLHLWLRRERDEGVQIFGLRLA